MSAKRSGGHRPKPTSIDDALPAAMALELVPFAEAIELLEPEYFRRAHAYSESHPNDPSVIGAHEAVQKEITKGWHEHEHETDADPAYMARLRKKQRRDLAMTLELARLSSENAQMTRQQAVDAVAGSFACDTRTVLRAGDEWVIDSEQFQQVLKQYQTAVQNRLTQPIP